MVDSEMTEMILNIWKCVCERMGIGMYNGRIRLKYAWMTEREMYDEGNKQQLNGTMKPVYKEMRHNMSLLW